MPQILISDGHDSHITACFMKFVVVHNIMLLIMPAYVSHLIKAIDILLFGSLMTNIFIN